MRWIVFYECDYTEGPTDLFHRELEAPFPPQLGWKLAGLINDDYIGPPTIDTVTFHPSGKYFETWASHKDCLPSNPEDREETRQELISLGWTLD